MVRRVHATPLDGALARASEAGVTRMVCVGTDAGSSAEAVALAQSSDAPGSPAQAEGIEAWATVGLHPHDACDGVDEAVAVLDAAARTVDATGAYRWWRQWGSAGSTTTTTTRRGTRSGTRSPPRSSWPARHGLALVIHTREAWDDTFDVLAATGVPERTVFHCFTGGPTEARRCLDIGAFLSFSGIVTFKNAGDVREAAAAVPDRPAAGGDRLAVSWPGSSPGIGQRAGRVSTGRCGGGHGQGLVG